LLYAIILLIGVLGEELGWRGYVLDLLQKKWSAFISSLFIGVGWALWHLPLFFMSGSYQNKLEIGGFSFWIFMADLLPISIIMTWIYNNTQRSTLSAVLFHFMINFNPVEDIFSMTKEAHFYRLIISAILASLIVYFENNRFSNNHHEILI
jgi:membrane protease YdiL (CAAX protease family)